MNTPTWTPRRPEIVVPYDPEQRRLYSEGSRRSVYHPYRWPARLSKGIYVRGRFPEIAVRAAFQTLGFSVLPSHSGLPPGKGFILAHYAKKRAEGHHAYLTMCELFGRERVEEFNRLADEAKRYHTGNRGGGDPDLFVVRGRTRFFIEVKDKDQLRLSQIVTFRRIEKMLGCEVRLARIKREPGARLDDVRLS